MFQSENILYKFHIVTTLFLVASMPFYFRIQIYALAVWSVTAVFNYKIISENFKLFYSKKNNKILLFTLIAYIISILISALISENQHSAWNITGRKPVLLLAPLGILAINFNNKFRLKHIATVYVFANLIAATFMLGHATYMLSIKTDASFMYLFTYQQLAFFMHPSYAAMHIILSLSFILYFAFFYKEKTLFSNKIISGFLIILFLTIIFLLSAKSGLFSLLATMLIFFIKLFFKYKEYKLLKLILLSVIFSSLIYVTLQNSRFNTQVVIVKEYFMGKGLPPTRFVIWQEAIKIIKENTFIGIGSGDLITEINKDILKISNPKNNKYNSHSDFLEVWVTSGLIGIIPFIMLQILLYIKAFKMKSFFSITFIIIMTINMISETILNRFSGIMIFAFFFSLFFVANIESSESNL